MFEALRQIEPASVSESAPSALASTSDAPPLVLLIDDEPMVGRFLAHAVEEYGYRALATISAESFQREYRLLRPDIVAVDLAIPGADGVEMLRFLAQEKCEVPIIIISGHDRRVLDSATRLGEALGLHMAGYLAKPVRYDTIADLLSSLKAGA